MSSDAVLLDVRFLAQVEDQSVWEERFDLLITGLSEEYKFYFHWTHEKDEKLDVAFLLYPAAHHGRMATDRVLEKFVSANVRRLDGVFIIAFGPNSKGFSVSDANVVDLVNDQCHPDEVRTGFLRVLRPEDIDDEVRSSLVRIYNRKHRGAPQLRIDSPRAESSNVTNSLHSSRAPYESGDL